MATVRREEGCRSVSMRKLHVLRAAQSLDRSLAGSLLVPVRTVYVRSSGPFKRRSGTSRNDFVQAHPAGVEPDNDDQGRRHVGCAVGEAAETAPMPLDLPQAEGCEPLDWFRL